MAPTSQAKFPARFGKYILLDRINAGGMAEVYRAKVTGMEQFQRLIAIKCMLPALHDDEQFVTMFIDEAKLSSQLSHANVVQIYELGQIEKQLYIAMELINGRDLRSVLRVAKSKGAPLPFGFAAYVMAKAAEGLDFAHHKTGVQGEPLNLVHRDVSPQNILVSYEGEVKVVDFGIAKAEERATETRSGVLKGKFAYMAPEQVAGSPIDARADIFALGCVLYETLAGKKLFTGESDLSILDKVRNASVPTFEVHIPGAPLELYDVLKRSLRKDANERFSRANEFAEALEPVLIEDRKIFGAKRAREFMHELYAEEIAELAERNKRWIAVTDADCEEGHETANKTQIFESTFAREGTGASSGGVASPSGGTIQLDEPTSSQPQPGPDGAAKKGTDPKMAAARPRMPTGDGDLRPVAETSKPRMPAGDGSMRTVAETSKPRVVGEADDTRDDRDGPEPPTSTSISAADGFFEEGGTAVGGPGPEAAPADTMEPLPPTELGAEISGPAAEEAARQPLTVPRGIVYASVIGAVLMMGLVITVALLPVGRETGAASPTVTEVIEVAPGAMELSGEMTGTTVIELNPDGTPAQPARPARPASPPPAPPDTIIDVDEAGDVVVEDDGEDAKGKGKGKGKYGYVSVRATGAKAARIFVGTREVGKSPLPFLKLKVGKHRIKVVEDNDGGEGRSKTVSVTVLPKNTRKQPVRLVVPL